MRCGIATQTFHYALNYCSRHALFTSIDVSCALQGASVKELKDGGKEVGELLGASLPKELLASKNPFVQSVRELCAYILPERDQALVLERSNTELYSQKRSVLFGFRKRRVACL